MTKHQDEILIKIGQSYTENGDYDKDTIQPPHLVHYIQLVLVEYHGHYQHISKRPWMIMSPRIIK